MVTIILLVSRNYYLQKVFYNLDRLYCDPAETNLLCYVDGDLRLYQETRDFVTASKFHQKLCVYRKKGTPSVGSVRRRRQRIADIHNELKENIKDADFLFLIEDDTIFPTSTLETLLLNMSNYPYAGIISGVEIGRWGYTMIGAWQADDVYEPQRIVSVANGSGIQKVDATGLYCCIVRKSVYMDHNFAPLDDVLGPDVNFGLNLRRKGLDNYINYDIKCIHLTQKEPITVEGSQIVRVEIKKINDKWMQSRLN